jgi:hypothetical protein
MASFRLYNIQLLPLDTARTPEVGVAGYKKLFEHLGAAIKAAHGAKTLVESSFKLPHDTYFAPFTVQARATFAEGKWVKYQKAESVVDLYTNKNLFTAADGDAPVSNTYLFRFSSTLKHIVLRLKSSEESYRLPGRFKRRSRAFWSPSLTPNFRNTR